MLELYGSCDHDSLRLEFYIQHIIFYGKFGILQSTQQWLRALWQIDSENQCLRIQIET